MLCCDCYCLIYKSDTSLVIDITCGNGQSNLLVPSLKVLMHLILGLQCHKLKGVLNLVTVFLKTLVRKNSKLDKNIPTLSKIMWFKGESMSFI